VNLISVTSDDIDKKILKDLISNENPVIFEVGCYDGEDTVGLVELFNSPIVYAFDADDRSIDLFYAKTAENFREKINFNKLALTNTDGKVLWFASNSNTRRHYEDQRSWSASSSIKGPKDCLNVFADITFSSDSYVMSMKLDTWSKLNIEHAVIDLIWADVNGAEREFILGAKETLSKTRFFYTEFSKTENVQLYQDAISRSEILDLLPDFEEIGVFSYMGNYGNVLLRNKRLA
jgi:FkbM family methyltransferase